MFRDQGVYFSVDWPQCTFDSATEINGPKVYSHSIYSRKLAPVIPNIIHMILHRGFVSGPIYTRGGRRCCIISNIQICKARHSTVAIWGWELGNILLKAGFDTNKNSRFGFFFSLIIKSDTFYSTFCASSKQHMYH